MKVKHYVSAWISHYPLVKKSETCSVPEMFSLGEDGDQSYPWIIEVKTN
jgi:hypothetical protein